MQQHVPYSSHRHVDPFHTTGPFTEMNGTQILYNVGELFLLHIFIHPTTIWYLVFATYRPFSKSWGYSSDSDGQGQVICGGFCKEVGVWPHLYRSWMYSFHRCLLSTYYIQVVCTTKRHGRIRNNSYPPRRAKTQILNKSNALFKVVGSISQERMGESSERTFLSFLGKVWN